MRSSSSQRLRNMSTRICGGAAQISLRLKGMRRPIPVIWRYRQRLGIGPNIIQTNSPGRARFAGEAVFFAAYFFLLQT